LVKINCFVFADAFAETAFLLFEVETTFVNVSYQWNCLSEVNVDGFIFRNILVKLVGIFNGTVFYTGSTTRALIFINIPRFFNQRDLKVPRFTFYTINFCID
jgi:hypothetical protein